MINMLVTILFTVCPQPVDGHTNKCHEQILNCVYQAGTPAEITSESINKCVRVYVQGKRK